jgi:hypothetical protein
MARVVLIKYLQPTSSEIERLALRETDHRYCSEFTAITLGFPAAVVILVAIGFAAVVISPFRLIGGLLGRVR